MPPRVFERSRSERLEDIIAWGQKAAGFIARMQLGEFARDEKTLIAVSKCVEVVGEAAAQLLKAFPEVQIEHPDLELAAARRSCGTPRPSTFRKSSGLPRTR
jgi:uncharacterized protein with HEPN domain